MDEQEFLTFHYNQTGNKINNFLENDYSIEFPLRNLFNYVNAALENFKINENKSDKIKLYIQPESPTLMRINIKKQG